MRSNGDVLPMVLHCSEVCLDGAIQTDALRSLVRPEVAYREQVINCSKSCFLGFQMQQEQQRMGKVSRRRAALQAGNENNAKKSAVVTKTFHTKPRTGKRSVSPAPVSP